MKNHIRTAKYGDADNIALILYQRWSSNGVKYLVALKRARQMVAHANRSKKTCKMLVSTIPGPPGNRDIVCGFLYAVERPAFDMVSTSFLEVRFLVSNTEEAVAVDLLKHLRSLTAKRILVQGWKFFGSIKAFERLLRPLKPESLSVTYQI